MKNIQCENEIAKTENARLNFELKDNEKFCPGCGRAISREKTLCDYCGR